MDDDDGATLLEDSPAGTMVTSESREAIDLISLNIVWRKENDNPNKERKLKKASVRMRILLTEKGNASDRIYYKRGKISV